MRENAVGDNELFPTAKCQESYVTWMLLFHRKWTSHVYFVLLRFCICCMLRHHRRSPTENVRAHTQRTIQYCNCTQSYAVSITLLCASAKRQAKTLRVLASAQMN